MRRLSPLLILVLFLLALPAPGSSAQEPPSVRLTLLSQTPWNTTAETEPVLDVRFRAENTGDTELTELSLGVTLYSRVITRSAYEASLVADPLIVIDAETLPREGSLQPGAIRDFEVSFALDSPGLDQDQSGVYPLKVDLRSAELSLGALRTPVIFLVREPEVPLALSWTIVLDHPISFGPDGTFVDDSLEVALAPGGRINGQIRALLELAQLPSATVEVAVSPVLLTQLGRMRNGYSVAEPEGSRGVPAGEGGAELAAQALDDLRTIVAAPGVRVTAMPFSTPEIPSLYGGGLDRDVAIQLERGREVVASFLQSEPAAEVLRPPGSALDDTTLRGLASLGIGTLIVDPDTIVIPPQPLELTGPATARLAEGGIAAISPDPATDAVLVQLAAEDPVRAAQAALGELATIWLERPGESRGVAVVLGEDLVLPGPFFVPHARGVAAAPWLDTVTPAELVLGFPPVGASELTSPSFRRFGASYVAALKQARRRVDTLSSMLPADSEQPARLETDLLLAEARQFLSEPDEGLAFIGAVRIETDVLLDSLSLDTVSTITLTSESGGGVPVTVTNGGPETLRFSVRLVSQHLRETLSSDLELAPGASETLRFQAQLRSTGRFPVRVQVVSPNGRVIEQETIVVRSTEYNRIAIVITVGAALVLLVLWARRFVPRRNA
ncbi:MAG TPA: DUF6049 family protein [Actinomycetota bacterium]|nr:DUF6049 family protein [Actinomycetota bacterium]